MKNRSVWLKLVTLLPQRKSEICTQTQFLSKITKIWLFWSKIVKICKNLLCNTFKYHKKKFQEQSCLVSPVNFQIVKNVKGFRHLLWNFSHVKILWNRNVVQLKSSMNSVIWREFSVNLIDKWIWREKSVKMMMPMEDIPSPRTAGEYK